MPANKIARWDGAAWHPLGQGIPGVAGVYALTEFDSDLIVGGFFTSVAGAIPASNIAGWDGQNWYALGAGVNQGVWALASYNGDAIAGGEFTLAGGQTARHIARWDGTSWSPLGTGSNYAVLGLTVYKGDLIAAGWFNEIGGHFTSVGRWDGASWHPTGLIGGAGDSVDALAVHNSELYAAASMEFGFMVLLRWDGLNWVILDATTEWDALSLTSFSGNLIGAGRVSASGSGSAIRRWTGTAWESLGAGIPYPGTVYALLGHDGVLHVGGNFATAGGLSSPNWARWGCSCYPDCNNSGDLTVADFGCYQTQFVAAHPYADCNSDGALTVQDFGCFQTRFVAGCP